MLTYMYVPGWILNKTDLSLIEKSFLGIIVGFSNDTGQCQINNQTLANVAGISVRQVQRYLVKLCKKELLSVVVKKTVKREIETGLVKFGTERTLIPKIFSGREGGHDKNVIRGMKPMSSIKETTKETTFNNYPETGKVPLRGEVKDFLLLCSQLKRASKQVKGYGDLDPDLYIPPVILAAAEGGIKYYYKRYAEIMGVPHPIYKYRQIYDCFSWLAIQLNNYSKEVPDIISAIDHWFTTSKEEENNLRLNHFLGGEDNHNLFNSLEAVTVTATNKQ